MAGACDRHDADLVVLAGDHRQRRAVHRKLPARLHAHVVETEHGSRSDGGNRLLDADVERARADRLHQRADDELDRYLSARDATAEGCPRWSRPRVSTGSRPCSYGQKARTAIARCGSATAPTSWPYAARNRSTWARSTRRRRGRTTR